MRTINYILLSLASLICLSSCSEEQPSEKKKYSIYTMAKDGSEYISQTNNLTGGSINPLKDGARVSPHPLWYDLIVKDGYYYRFNHKTKYFIKFEVKNNRFAAVDSVSIPEFSFIENYNWIHPDTLLLIAYNRKLIKLKYARLDVKSMKAISGDVPISLHTGKYNSVSIGFTELRKDKLFVGYTYHNVRSAADYNTADTVYVSILKYPSFQTERVLKDTRSTYPGSINTAQKSTFKDKNGDFYFLSCPGIALGNRPDMPTAIYRIKAGEEKLDSSFFFNISDSPVRNHAYGLWDIGSGKAIIRNERKDLFTGMEDHYKVPHIEFYVVDLNKRSVEKLKLPLDKGTSRQCVLTENGLVYISINSAEGNYIWIYNPKDGGLTKGLKLDGDVDYILRMERLYNE